MFLCAVSSFTISFWSHDGIQCADRFVPFYLAPTHPTRLCSALSLEPKVHCALWNEEWWNFRWTNWIEKYWMRTIFRQNMHVVKLNYTKYIVHVLNATAKEFSPFSSFPQKLHQFSQLNYIMPLFGCDRKMFQCSFVFSHDERASVGHKTMTIYKSIRFPNWIPYLYM